MLYRKNEKGIMDATMVHVQSAHVRPAYVTGAEKIKQKKVGKVLRYSLNFLIMGVVVLFMSACGSSENKPAENIQNTPPATTNQEVASNTSTTSNNGNVQLSNNETDSEDWDKLLAQYEDFVDRYAKLIKKASKGDASAISEYPGVLESAQELEKQLQGGKSKMSSSQAARLLKLQEKLAKAALTSLEDVGNSIEKVGKTMKDVEKSMKDIEKISNQKFGF